MIDHLAPAVLPWDRQCFEPSFQIEHSAAPETVQGSLAARENTIAAGRVSATMSLIGAQQQICILADRRFWSTADMPGAS
jgi:hypothetical protein